MFVERDPSPDKVSPGKWQHLGGHGEPFHGAGATQELCWTERWTMKSWCSWVLNNVIRVVYQNIYDLCLYIYIYLNKYNTYILSGCWYFLTCVLMITWLLFLCLEATSIAGGDFAGVIFCRFRPESFMGIFLERKNICWSNSLHAQTQLKMKIQWVVFQVVGGNCVFLKVVRSQASCMLEFTVNNVSVDTRCI